MFTLGHFVFAPLIAPVIKKILNARDAQETLSNDGEVRVEEARVTQDLRAWLNIHVTRMLVADVPGWACFLVAAVKLARM